MTEKAKNIAMAIFIILGPYLLTTKIRCLQKNNIRHTRQELMSLMTRKSTPKLYQNLKNLLRLEVNYICLVVLGPFENASVAFSAKSSIHVHCLEI